MSIPLWLRVRWHKNKRSERASGRRVAYRRSMWRYGIHECRGRYVLRIDRDFFPMPSANKLRYIGSTQRRAGLHFKAKRGIL